ncbi:MAG: GAF domain-containing sensor histidine kinase [Ilumatobacteraceae bacterium]
MTILGPRDQLESLHQISVEIAALRELPEIYDRALTYCLGLTRSTMGFVDLIQADGVAMDVVAVKGFVPLDAHFFERFKTMPVRPSVFGVVITEQRAHISNDVDHDPLGVGQPPGHPRVHSFLGVPLQIGSAVIGMIGVANNSIGYTGDDEQLLSTFANQVAVAIDNARLYQHQRDMIARLQQLQERLGSAEREQLLALERDRIAAGLHDEIEQQLFLIGLGLSSLLEDERLPPELAERVRDIRHLAGGTAQAIRDVIFALAVDGHKGGDLTGSIRRLLSNITDGTGIDTDLVITGTPTAAVAGVQGALHAVVKEALNNVVKHANAHMALVSVRFEPDSVTITIQDDGEGSSGLALQQVGGSQMHFGLRNMRRQIAALGGETEIENGEEGGFTVRVCIPIEASVQ